MKNVIKVSEWSGKLVGENPKACLLISALLSQWKPESGEWSCTDLSAYSKSYPESIGGPWTQKCGYIVSFIPFLGKEEVMFWKTTVWADMH